jgi:hypothetical protein
VTFLLNITSIKNKKVCPYELLFGCKPMLPTNLRYFGEIGIVTSNANIQRRLKNREKPWMFVGYPVNQANGV